MRNRGLKLNTNCGWKKWDRQNNLRFNEAVFNGNYIQKCSSEINTFVARKA
jgi:hypothetical protein